MTKVRIRRVARTRWQLVTFYGKGVGNPVGLVDLLAIRKDHGPSRPGMKRGDDFQIILIQVKGGSSAVPIAEDGMRIRAVAKRHRTKQSLLGVWEKGESSPILSVTIQGISRE